MGAVQAFLGEHIFLGLDMDFQPWKPRGETVPALAKVSILDVPPDVAATIRE